MTAPFTAEQETRLERIEQAPPAPESCEEVVARAMHHEWHPDEDWDATPNSVQGYYHRLARAALAAMQGPDPAAAAVQRVEALADELDEAAAGVSSGDPIEWAADRLRDALRGESR